ncbi:MAG: MFS transporter [Candidatus Syntrophopropionicum ammoniitolerans]
MIKTHSGHNWIRRLPDWRCWTAIYAHDRTAYLVSISFEGAGVGILMPLSESLIYDYFTGKERVKMMGYNSAFSNFGGIITMLIAGWLATFSWQQPFNVYLLGLLIFVLVFFYLPPGEITQPPQHERNLKIPLAVYGYSIAMGAIILAYYAVATNMALYLEQTNLGGSALAGMIISFAAIGGMMTSLFLVQVMAVLKDYLIPVMLSAMAIPFLVLSFTNSVPVVMISVCFIGFAQDSLFPVLTMKALNSVKLHQTDKTIAVATAFIFSGQFISPLVLDTISKIANQTAIRFQFAVLSVSILIAVVIISICTHQALAKNREANKCPSSSSSLR